MASFRSSIFPLKNNLDHPLSNFHLHGIFIPQAKHVLSLLIRARYCEGQLSTDLRIINKESVKWGAAKHGQILMQEPKLDLW